MRSEEEIKQEIIEIKLNSHDILYSGGLSTVQVNAPRALMQLNAIAKLTALHWVLGIEFHHKWKKPTNC